jgi:hypothetical protein
MEELRGGLPIQSSPQRAWLTENLNMACCQSRLSHTRIARYSHIATVGITSAAGRRRAQPGDSDRRSTDIGSRNEWERWKVDLGRGDC